MTYRKRSACPRLHGVGGVQAGLARAERKVVALLKRFPPLSRFARVESRSGAVARRLRFQIPLIKPDMRLSLHPAFGQGG